jgi:hypothetical protein
VLIKSVTIISNAQAFITGKNYREMGNYVWYSFSQTCTRKNKDNWREKFTSEELLIPSEVWVHLSWYFWSAIGPNYKPAKDTPTAHILMINTTALCLKLQVISELLGFWTLSIVLYSRNKEKTTFRKLGLFPSSGEGADIYSGGSLRNC